MALDLFTILDLTSALSVLIPGAVLLTLLRGVSVPSLRNMTILLASFSILHGFYHLSYLIDDFYEYAPYMDLATALILLGLGLYYSQRILAVSLFALTLPEASTYAVPIVLAITLLIFARLAIKSKTISSLQSQMSIFLIIWVVAELLRSLLLLHIFTAPPSLQLLGFEIHTAAMIAFGFFIIFRYSVVMSSSSSLAEFNWLSSTTDHDLKGRAESAGEEMDKTKTSPPAKAQSEDEL